MAVGDDALAEAHGVGSRNLGNGLHVGVQPQKFSVHARYQRTLFMMSDDVGEERDAGGQALVHEVGWGRIYVNSRLSHLKIDGQGPNGHER